MNDWLQASVTLPLAKAEWVSTQWFDLGCGGVQEDDTESKQHVCLIAYFEITRERAQLEREIQEVLVASEVSSEVRIEDVPDTDWTISWRSFFKPVYPTPRIAVCPPWDKVPDPPDGFTITIDPQMAFGTGHHETTRLALLALEKSVRPGDGVLDLGTGSGILSIAAAKMGAREVMGVDVEAPAIDNAKLNCIANGVEAQVQLAQHSVGDVSGIFDVVVANIISSILLPMVPDLVKRLKPEGHIVLGGILERERDTFCDVLASSHLFIDEMLMDGEWVCAIGHRA